MLKRELLWKRLHESIYEAEMSGALAAVAISQYSSQSAAEHARRAAYHAREAIYALKEIGEEYK